MIAKICVVIGMCLFWWLMCYLNTGSDKKNLLGLRSYPPEVQELVRTDPVLGQSAPAEANLVKIFFSNLLLFTVVFLIIGVILKYTVGFNGFVDAFLYILILGEVLNLFDLLVIDLLWWRNTPRIRFSCVEDKALYQDPKMHVGSFVRGLPMYLVVALIVAGILAVLP